MTLEGAVKRAKISILRAQGYSDQEIAVKLEIEPSTVNYHKGKIREKVQESDDFVQNLLNNFEKELGI